MRKFGMRLATVTALVLGANSAVNAAETQRYTFSGSQTFIVFNANAAQTCPDGSFGFAYASGSLSGAEQIQASTGSPTLISNGIYVQLNGFYNSCTGLSVGGSGSVPYGFTPPDRKMESSALAGSTQVQDYGTGALVPVTFDIAVVGSGPTYQTKANNKTTVKGSKSGPISISVNHSGSANRSGDADGTMVIDGVSLSVDFFYASMSANGTKEVAVTK
jgi:hypothetical protein